MNHTHASRRYFPHEKLRAYELARRAVRFVHERAARLKGIPGEIGPQLERAVVGTFTNYCSGGSAFGAESRRHFRIALTECGEAGGCIDAVFDYGVFDEAEHRELREILLELYACLRGLADI